MKNITYILGLLLFIPLYAQEEENCFLEDFFPKNAEVPSFLEKDKTISPTTAIVTIDNADTLGKISQYIFGNAIAAWLGNDINNSTFLGHVDKLSPTLIRYPGGSWADIFFWDGVANNIPDSLVDGTNGQKYAFYPQYGTGSWPTTLDTYYDMRWDLDTEGLITINYAYARYGTGEKPVEEAAHYAAEWVRYDDGRTRFWEIGNENGGPWEAGWQIDLTLNQDEQPEVITGQLYGQHFKIFADSMRAAAAELDVDIYIGGQILHYDGTGSWNIADHEWNEGFFSEVGDAADYYVIHNYFGTSVNARHLLDVASTIPEEMINFIRGDISEKGASPKPIALTEYNMQGWEGYELAKGSIINGMQAVILFNELIKLNYGMSSRWLLANWESDGMLYKGNDSSIPAWSPRPDFFYVYYLPQFTGDHVLSITSGHNNIVAYASTFNSGELGAVIVNKGVADQVVKINVRNKTVGDKFYVYSLTGGDDNSPFSQYVYVNEDEPTENYFGPIEDLEDIPAWAYPIGEEIKINSPGRSVQFVMIEPGENVLSIKKGDHSSIIKDYELHQNYPNPFNPESTITFSLPHPNEVTLKVFDITGREISVLVNGEKIETGTHSLIFNGSNLPSGTYFCRFETNDYVETKKMLLIK